jgi:phospholipase C
MTSWRGAVGRLIVGASLALAASAAAGPRATLEGVPRFAHIFVIIEENKDFDQILGGVDAPQIATLAKTYGNATRFYGEVHPSEGNYVALLSGDTNGIHDDDPWYCKPGAIEPTCAGAGKEANYEDHTVHGPGLADQILAARLTWKAYLENLPAPGSLAFIASDPSLDDGTPKTALYAAKHAGFVNFASVQSDPHREDHLVGFDQLQADLKSGHLPHFALIVPNQCNEMHGLIGARVPPDCLASNKPALIRRGDAEIGRLVAELQATAAWRGRDNAAIIITFDEGAGGERSGCCAVTPEAPSNFGGGHIPTLVLTNHGPRGLVDDTPYNHYSLLRTIEDAFGIKEHLRHAADTDKGVLPMVRLFGGA